MESLLQFFMAYMFVFLIITIVIYIAVGIFLNKFNRLVYGKGTPMAFIPIVNIYLLGKLTFNKKVGLIITIVPIILTGTLNITVNGVETSYTLFPDNIGNIISNIFSLIYLGLFIYAIYLYFKLKKEKNNSNYVNDNKEALDNNVNQTSDFMEQYQDNDNNN